MFYAKDCLDFAWGKRRAITTKFRFHDLTVKNRFHVIYLSLSLPSSSQKRPYSGYFPEVAGFGSEVHEAISASIAARAAI